MIQLLRQQRLISKNDLVHIMRTRRDLDFLSHSKLRPYFLVGTFCSTPNLRVPNQEKPLKRPDLKKAAKPFGPIKIVPIACLLMLAYMYPMILKPLLGIGQEEDDIKDKLKELEKLGVNPSSTRPQNMPEWTNPFAPRSENDDR